MAPSLPCLSAEHRPDAPSARVQGLESLSLHPTSTSSSPSGLRSIASHFVSMLRKRDHQDGVGNAPKTFHGKGYVHILKNVDRNRYPSAGSQA